jgi:hypothetical protein
VAAQVLADLVGELRADVEDERPWDDATRRELVERLEVVVADLGAPTPS